MTDTEKIKRHKTKRKFKRKEEAGPDYEDVTLVARGFDEPSADSRKTLKARDLLQTITPTSTERCVHDRRNEIRVRAQLLRSIWGRL